MSVTVNLEIHTDMLVKNDCCARVDLSHLRSSFKTIAEVLPVALIVFDSNGLIALVNQRAEQLFGFNRGELFGLTVESLIPERFRAEHPHHRAEFAEQPQSRQTGAGRDLFGLRKDGSEFPIEIGLNPVETEEGLFVLIAITDLTVRKCQEDDFKKLIARLDESNRELEQFAYVASHDLQEPLRKVASCCQALAEDFSDKLNDEGREWIAFAIDGAGRMRQLINDLLEFSQVARHGKESEPTDANKAYLRAMDNLDDSVHKHNAKIVCRPLPTVLADESQLVQLFQNLIGNAMTYCNSQQPLVEIGAERDGHFWRFFVKDNGIGIAPEFHERIFQVFQRLHRKEEYPGTGIGLAICKKVVERHGGRLTVESQLGQGSKFIFTLPATDR